MEEQIVGLSQRVCALEEDGKRNSEAHREFYAKFEQMKIDIAISGNQISGINSKLDEISKDVKEIKENPGKKWETLVMYVLTSVVGLAIGFALKGIFPG